MRRPFCLLHIIQDNSNNHKTKKIAKCEKKHGTMNAFGTAKNTFLVIFRMFK